MATVLQRYATAVPTVCGGCRRRAIWLGWSPPYSKEPPVWICGHEGCRISKVYHMNPQDFDAYEIGAMAEGGDKGGQYLDSIGKTDLAVLDGWEWEEFLRRVLHGYEKALRRKLENDEPAI